MAHRQNIFQQTSRHFIGDHRGPAGFNIFQCRVRIIAGPVAEQTDCLCITLFTTAPVHPKPGYRNNAKQRPVPYFLFAFDSARSKAVRAPDMVLSIFVCLQLDHRLLDRIQQQRILTPIIRCRSGSPDFWIVISSSVRLEPDSSVMTIWSVSCIIASCCGG